MGYTKQWGEDMKETTLGYIENDGSYLMLLRNKKENDQSKNKWLGVGGHIEENETPDECFVREVKEETGIDIKNYKKCGEIKFFSDIWEDEIMHLYIAETDSREFMECNEGTLKWIPKADILNLNLWEGDVIFLKRLLAGDRDINISLYYEGDRLVNIKEHI